MTPKAVQKKADLANKYIAKSNKDEIWAIEPDSTWEEAYEFQPVQIKGKFIYIQYKEPYNKGKKTKDRYNINDINHEDDIKYALNWIIRAVKKGYREEGQKIQFENKMKSKIKEMIREEIRRLNENRNK